jgi:thymidylate synthase (FAD)
MSAITFRSDSSVELIDFMGSDSQVVHAARISTSGTRLEPEIKTTRGLIRYLMKNRHGTPFEHNAFTFRVECPIFVAREFMRHRIASYNEECLAGDTVVTRLSPNLGGTTHKKNATLEVLWRNWHVGIPDSLGRTRLLPSCRNIYVRSFNEHTLTPEKSRVVDIKKKGVQRTYLVTTESGHQIRATMSHKFFTPTGWFRLEELAPGFAHIYRSGKVKEPGAEAYVPPRTRQGIQVWTTQQKPFVVPAEGTNCYLCGNPFSYAELQLDHEVPVVKDIARALDVTNLKPACKPCHRTKSNSEQIYASRGVTAGLRVDRIVSVSDPLDEETYDLVLEDPHHNFLGNGLVVHNSARYKTLDAVFWVPYSFRPMVQTGKPGHYVLEAGTKEQHDTAVTVLKRTAGQCYEAYEELLESGIAREVARACLTVGIYTSFYVTMNARGLMNFLSLRVDDPDSAYPSKPQYEIEGAARQMEKFFSELMPVTWDAYRAAGRVAP